uniref:Uncharacterized protein n=1 Tax=Anguilla anguilla TaxID=7936 RepID=A0A0E9SD38_ANGAN
MHFVATLPATKI